MTFLCNLQWGSWRVDRSGDSRYYLAIQLEKAKKKPAEKLAFAYSQGRKFGAGKAS